MDIRSIFFLLTSRSSEIGNEQRALNDVIEHVSTLQTKLDAYALQSYIFFNACDPHEMNQLLMTIVTTLNSLGQKIHDTISIRDVQSEVSFVMSKFEEEPDDALMNLSTATTENHDIIMQAYSIIASLAYVARPKLYPYFAASWSNFCLKHKASSKYTPGED
jgi:hypothetical protein